MTYKCLCCGRPLTMKFERVRMRCYVCGEWFAELKRWLWDTCPELYRKIKDKGGL